MQYQWKLEPIWVQNVADILKPRAARVWGPFWRYDCNCGIFGSISENFWNIFTYSENSDSPTPNSYKEHQFWTPYDPVIAPGR
jgi:hypothetical protein